MAERGRGRAEAWRPWSAAGPAAVLPIGLRHFLQRAVQHVADWLRAEAAAGQLVPWLPVAFGAGVVIYFTAEREPLLVPPFMLLTVAVAAAVLLRERAAAFAVAVLIACVVAGFAAATLKRAMIDHPVLHGTAWNVEIGGFVEVSEERERSDRVVVRVHHIAAPRLDAKLERVRISVRKGTAPPVGSFVEFKARLSSPLQPLRPGGYDFARDMYFQGIGASGFALGRIRVVEPPAAPGLWLRYASLMASWRDAIDARIRAVLPGDRGAIASALITGKRDAITTPVNDAMFVSSLGHVLSISGYHMAVVASLVFFVLRASLALIPEFANRHPIKKWAAAVALAAATFYLLLSGSEVATQRSFIMIAIVLIGVMADRAALTLRTLTIAAFIVLLLAPEAVVHPSFQMSFAATLALVSAYRGGFAWTSAGVDSSLGARIALWGVREIVMLIAASLLAGFATTPYAAYHFHRLAPYGMIANLLAMPVVSAWVMPMGILGVVALPFGLDGFCWRMMGDGLDWMIAVSQWVAGLPGALGRIAAFGNGPLLLGTLGLIVFCLLRTPLRMVGVGLFALASFWAVQTSQPDILVSGDGASFAVRTSEGKLSAIKSGSDTFAIRDWLAADADGRQPTDRSLTGGIACDSVGCIGRLADGHLVALVRSIEAFEEDCRRTAVVISAREAPRDCQALLIDRKVLQRSGAIALTRAGEGFSIVPARTEGYDRPWAPRPPVRAADDTPAAPAPAGQSRDATPRTEDLEPGD